MNKAGSQYAMITLQHSNRFEILAERLARELATDADPLRPEWIVVPNPGTGRWFSRYLARRHGIAANLDYPLPATFFWRVLSAWLPDRSGSPFDREALLWRIQARLPELLGSRGFEELERYLQGEDPGLRLHQLAGRIADSFDQYLVFRPEMVLGWEEGRDQHWQARLWRAMAGPEAAHRARLLKQLAEAMKQPPPPGHDLPERVFFLGLNALPPVYLQILRELGRHLDIHIGHLNPSRAYWADLTSERARSRRALAFARDDDPFAPFLDLGNPLLASMGHVGQVFLDQLLELEAREEELFESPAGRGLLARVQEEILELRDGREHPEPAPREASPSIQVHGTHTPLREVQVLHDNLLRCFEELDDLRPHEILVMAPDMAAYAPLVEAVFATAPAELRIPFSIADQPRGTGTPLGEAIRWLMQLPSSRLGAGEVLDLLAVEAVQRRFGLEPEALEAIRRWVRESGIRWAADEKHRQDLGLPGDDGLHSWRFGLRRLFLGYLAPVDEESLYGETVPYPDIEGAELLWAGALQSLIERLDRWRIRLGKERPLPEWLTELHRLLRDFLDPGEEELPLLQAIDVRLDELAALAREGGFHGRLPLSVMRELLDQLLDDRSSARHFLQGGVTFSNLLPMRALPFRVVCLLGMNSADFPRHQVPSSFDLMARSPRRGDRSRRLDDRYLFLEALLSARDRLLISYQSRGVRDNKVRLPSEMVSELLDYLDGCYSDEPRLSQRLFVEHPLQAFSPRYFDGQDPRLFTFDAGWAMPPDDQEPPGFVEEPLPRQQPDRQLTLDDLLNFFRNPARAFLNHRLSVRLPGEEERLEESEPFALDALESWQARELLLQTHLSGMPPETAWRRLRGEGRLPHGMSGELAHEEAEEESRRLAGILRPLLLERPLQPPFPLELELEGWQLQGMLAPFHGDGLIDHRVGRLRGQDHLSLWIRHLALCSAVDAATLRDSQFVTLEERIRFPTLEAGKARTLLLALLELYEEGLQQPLPFFPRTAWAWINDDRKWLESWEGAPYRGYPGECTDPAIALVHRDRDPLDERFEAVTEAIYRPILDHMETA